MRHLRPIIALLVWPGASLADEQVTIDQTKLAACTDMAGGKDRLACYRELTGRIPPLQVQVSRRGLDLCEAQAPGPIQLACYDSLFRSDRPGSLE